MINNNYERKNLSIINCSNYWIDNEGVIWDIKNNIWAKEDINHCVVLIDNDGNKKIRKSFMLYRIAFEKDFLLDKTKKYYS